MRVGYWRLEVGNEESRKVDMKVFQKPQDGHYKYNPFLIKYIYIIIRLKYYNTIINNLLIFY